MDTTSPDHLPDGYQNKILGLKRISIVCACYDRSFSMDCEVDRYLQQEQQSVKGLERCFDFFYEALTRLYTPRCITMQVLISSTVAGVRKYWNVFV